MCLSRLKLEKPATSLHLTEVRRNAGKLRKVVLIRGRLFTDSSLLKSSVIRVTSRWWVVDALCLSFLFLFLILPFYFVSSSTRSSVLPSPSRRLS